MGKRGRRSAASLELPDIIGKRPRLTAPAYLSDAEKVAFDEVIASVSDGHFVRSDLPVIVSFVQATELAKSLAQDPEARPEWCNVVKLQLALARALRLTVHSRATPRTITRNLPNEGPRPWMQHVDVDDDEEEITQ
jgi:hypothetical protein